MAVIERSALVLYSAQQMFELVNDVDRYPSFLPWCESVEVHSQSSSEVVASLDINKAGVRHRFTTCNQLAGDQHSDKHSIEMSLVDGPFRHLKGAWGFKVLNETACKVTLDLHFELSSQLSNLALGKVFHQIAGSMVDAFVRRAGEVYD